MPNIPMCIITEPNSNTINITLNFPKESILFIQSINIYIPYVLGTFVLTALLIGRFFKRVTTWRALSVRHMVYSINADSANY